jgi:predicted RNA-binding Zn ribbon-like protein
MTSNFPFTSGRLCLWFLATVGNRGSQPFERLETPADLSRWFVQAWLVDHLVSFEESDLQKTRLLRESIYRATLARIKHHAPEQQDREIINDWAARPPLVPQLNSDGRTLSWDSQRFLDAALAMIARDAVLLFANPEAERLKVCAQPVCAMLFLDTSRSGQRRWCSMNVCGNRAKKMNYRKERVLSHQADQ